MKFDLGQIQAIKPELIVLELGMNDISNAKWSQDALAAEMITLVNLFNSWMRKQWTSYSGWGKFHSLNRSLDGL